MVNQADTIRDSIETNWALTGELNKVTTDTMKEIVRFFDRDQIDGNEWPKAVTVVKINAEADEDRIEHPVFTEITDKYVITVRFRVSDADPDRYTTCLDLIEDMGGEIWRILKLTWAPNSTTGDFMQSAGYWTKRDHHDGAQIDLVRELNIKLTKIISEQPTVFTGFGGVLTFDVSDSSNMDIAPGGDYIYTEAHRVRIQEGFDTLAYLTKDKTLGDGVPQLRRGMFRGKFNSLIFAKKADVDGTPTSSANKLDNIYKMQSNGQHIQAVFLHAHQSLESSPSTLTEQTFIKVTSMEKLTDNEELVSFDVTGNLIKPSIWTVT